MAKQPRTQDLVLRTLAEADGPRTATEIAAHLLDAGKLPGLAFDTIRKRVQNVLSYNTRLCVPVGHRRGYGLTPAGRKAAAALDAPPSAASPRAPATDHRAPPLPPPPAWPRPFDISQPQRQVAITLSEPELDRARRDLAESLGEPDMGTDAARYHLRCARHHLVAYAALKAREHEA